MKKNFAVTVIAGLATLLEIMPLSSPAQLYQSTETNSATVKIVANKEYDKASMFKRIMLGEHYRREWAKEVEIEILDMDTTAGGLTPIKIGGGLQTKSLRLKGGDGKEYVLRSVNKDPSKAIVEELRGTFADDVVQDQISSANPYAPMVVASLAKAAGIFCSTPKMVYVTKSARLGEFAKEFAETVCILEERPSGNEEHSPAYGFSKQVLNSQKMLEKIFADSDHQVDEKAFLKARLFDILIGDWDRHEDQWQWAAFDRGDKTIYQPIPRDRDQAFSRMDGFIPQLATRKWGIRKVQHFNYYIRDVYGLSANGMHLDRNFTTRLGLYDWLAIAEQLQDVLTNDVIAAAFREMPDPIYNISGRETVAILKRRRDDLQKYATDYYQFLSEQVNITGTKEVEIFEVKRESDDFTTVTVYKSGKDKQAGKIIYQRTFLRGETKEIRLYGLEGDDMFNVAGETKKGILVRVIGGKGEDSYADNSSVKQSGHQTRIYDNSNSIIDGGKETKQYISSDSLKNGYNRRSFVFDWMAPMLSPGYNPDDGMLIGGGVIFKKQQFGKAPFGSMQSLAGNYAFSTGAYSAWYKGIFTEFIGRTDLHLVARFNSPTYTRNFYGLGNETNNDEKTGKDYYRVRIGQFTVSYSLNRKFGSKNSLSIGTEFQSIRVEDSEGRYITTGSAKGDSINFNRQKFTRTQVSYQFSTLNNSLYPTKGVNIRANAAFIQNLDETERFFAQMSSEAAFYNSLGRFTLAGRTGVATNLGNDYEFYQANYLGGLTNLRGYRRDRFAGKTTLYSSTELRFRVSSFNTYITKGVWGMLAFVDNGRVWLPNEESDNWHSGYGGGLWFLPFSKIAMTATYGVSKEDKIVSITAGFLF